MAREINHDVATEFARECKDRLGDIVNTVWSDTIQCFYDDDRFAIRQFVFKARHSWGSAYICYDQDTKFEIMEALKELGATNIKVYEFRWNYINICFDIKVREQKKREAAKATTKEEK